MRQVTNFESVRLHSEKNLPCPRCGRKTRRARTFTQTLNPFNRRADGTPKTPVDIHAELQAEAAEWRQTLERHVKCEEAP